VTQPKWMYGFIRQCWRRSPRTAATFRSLCWT